MNTDGSADSPAVSIGNGGRKAALERLEGRFLAPDPLMFWVRVTRSGADVDVEALAGRPRSAQPLVTAGQIESALADGLRPAPAYRLAWAVR